VEVYPENVYMHVCMDGTGVPAVKKEIKNRRGKHEDGLAKTREAKLGYVFTLTTVDEKGLPVRDEGSTTYVGYIETAEDFGDRIYAEALSRGLESAQKVWVMRKRSLLPLSKYLPLMKNRKK